MKTQTIFCLILLCVLLSDFQVSCLLTKNRKKKSSHQQDPLKDLANRILGKDLAANISFILDNQNSTIANPNASNYNEYIRLFSEHESKLTIKSNTKSGLARGLYYYMKEYMNSSISWNGDNIQKLDVLPTVQQEVHIQTPFELRYMFNYCTYSYSMSFWNWERWEREIDYMALLGINMPLAVVGTGKVWQNVLLQINYTQSEILDFIPGPGFEAWWLMGNLEGYGGPVSQDYIDNQASLQQKILKRMRELGMEPVLQGFFGMVPNSLKKKYPQVKIYGDQLWNGIRRPAVLDATEELFTQLAALFYQESEKLYGRAKFYGGDPFHEGSVVPGIDLTAQALSIYKSMQFKDSSDKKVRWVLQSWQSNPSKELLQGLQNDECVIIDLMAEARSKWQTDAFTNHNFIWSSLPNFGMRIGQYGMIEQYVSQPFLAYNTKNQTMKGIGSIPEGILTNVINYEILFDSSWIVSSQNENQQTPREKVLKYLESFIKFRYGESENKNLFTAWSWLTQSVYNSDNSWDGPSESTLLARPSSSVDRVSSWGTNTIYWNTTNVLEAWRYFMTYTKDKTGKYRSQRIQKQEEINKKLGRSEDDNMNVFVEIKQSDERNLFKDTFLFDLVDLARQNLASYSYLLYNKVMTAFNQTDTVKFAMYSQQFLELIKDQDDLLSSRREFLLGHYLEQAFNLGTTDEERVNFVNQFKRQYTTWSDFDTPLHDYANKEWSGMLQYFYLPRWELYFKSLQTYIVAENKKQERQEILREAAENGEDVDESEQESEDTDLLKEEKTPTKEELLKGTTINWFDFEIQFSKNNMTYPTNPQVSELDVTQRMYQKYYSVILAEHININQIKPAVQKQYQVRLSPQQNKSYTKFKFAQKNKQQEILSEE